MTANPEVMAMVREQLQRRSPPSTAALYGRAVRIDPSIRELTLRQFNARYPLQVRRGMAAGKPKGDGRPVAEPKLDRSRIREFLIRFARDVVAAEGTVGVIDALGGVDRYVDELVKAAGRS